MECIATVTLMLPIEHEQIQITYLEESVLSVINIFLSIKNYIKLYHE